MENVENLNNQVDFKNLICHCKCATKDIDFSNFIDAKTLFDSIKHKKIKIADVVKNQKEFNSKLSEIKTCGKKSKQQKNKTKNITSLYDAREEVIKFCYDFLNYDFS